MVERIKNLGFRDEVIGNRRSSGFSPQPERASPVQGFLRGFEAIERNKKAQILKAEREKEKALKSFLDTISVDYKTQMDLIASESPRNPRAIVEKGSAYRDGVVNQSPASLQPLISARIDNYLNLKRAKANKEATLEIQAQGDATEERLASRDFSILNEASAGIYSEIFDLRNASENEVQSLERELATRLFSKGVDDFGVEFNLHKKEDITARLQNFRDISQTSALKSWFREQRDPDTAYLQLKRGGFKVDMTVFKRKGKDGLEETFKQVNVMDALSEKARDKLFEDIASEIKSINTIADKEETQKIIDDKKSQLMTGFDNWRRLEEPEPGQPPLTATTIREQLESNIITKDDAVAQLKAINEPDPVEDDPIYYDVVDQQIDLGVDFLAEINEGVTAGLLKPKTAALFRTENRAVLDETRTSIDKAIDSASKDLLKDLNTGLKVNSIFTILDKDEGIRMVNARQEARRRINEIKSESQINTIEDVELYREKLNRLNAELIQTHRFQRNRIATPVPSSVPVATREQITKEKLKEGYLRLQKMKANGDISEEEFNRQAKEIMIEVQQEKNKNPESGKR